MGVSTRPQDVSLDSAYQEELGQGLPGKCFPSFTEHPAEESVNDTSTVIFSYCTGLLAQAKCIGCDLKKLVCLHVAQKVIYRHVQQAGQRLCLYTTVAHIAFLFYFCDIEREVSLSIVDAHAHASVDLVTWSHEEGTTALSGRNPIGRDDATACAVD
mmetsp:Transcript_79898/g.154403  ORF Transcript_79898/g.154403 Transcript_79898/m.154403 type:complete len:157 (-) Transcript_79898:1611-2081(-)